MSERSQPMHFETDPPVLDPRDVEARLAAGSPEYRAQYTKPPDDPATFRLLNELSEKYGRRFCVRFFAYRGGTFDGALLRRLPEVRNLCLDVERCEGLEHLAALRRLERLELGYKKGGPADALAHVVPERMERVRLVDTPRAFDLAPLAAFPRLNGLQLEGQVKGLDRLAGHPTLESLSLSCFAKDVDLSIVASFPQLLWLGVYLGGRDDLDALGHPKLKFLRVARVRGLRRIDLSRFPSLRVLQVEDQPQLAALDLSAARELNGALLAGLPALSTVGRLDGLRDCVALRFYKTGVPLDAVLAAPPPKLRGLAMFGVKSKGDAAVAARIAAAGYVDEYRMPEEVAFRERRL